MPYEPRRGFRKALRAREPKFGILALSGSPQLVEMAGFLGLDFAVIDMEHADGVGLPQVLHLIRAADASGLAPLVRVNRNSPELIQAVLDYGAAGVCVPHVGSAAEAAQAVASAKYPPDGVRSTCPYIRASSYGGRADVETYARDANQETIVMILVEDRRGLADLEAITAVPGVDALGVGFSDLARDLGLPGDAKHPALDDARRRASELAQRNGLVTWTNLITSAAAPEEDRSAELASLLEEGYTMFSWQDTSIFREAVLGLSVPRRAQAARPPAHI